VLLDRGNRLGSYQVTASRSPTDSHVPRLTLRIVQTEV
jgi:hypothetical protein